MIGNPGDTLDTIKESIDFAESCDLTGVEFYTALPYKGSELWNFVQESGRMLTSVQAHMYHNISPRIIFDTAEFPYQDILEAIRLVKEKSYYKALSKDRRLRILDMGRMMVNILKKIAGSRIGNGIYLWLRGVYHKLS